MKRALSYMILAITLIIGWTVQAFAIEATVPEQVVYDVDGLKMTLKGLETDQQNGKLKILIENNTEDKLIVQVRNFCINDYVIDTNISEEITPGMKANGAIKFSTHEIEPLYGIEEINDIHFQFIVYLNGFMDSYYTDTIHVTVEGTEDYEQQYDDSGVPVYEDDVIQIVSKGITDDGTSILLFAHNKTDGQLILQARDTSVDGFMMDAIMSFEIPPGAYTIDRMKFQKKDFEENDIEALANVKSGFIIYQNGFNTLEKIEDPIEIGIE